MDKLMASPAAAVADIGQGASIGIAGFGVAHRFPPSLIIALRDKGSAGLTAYCNGLGQPGNGAVRVLNSPAAVLVVVAGAGNAGVSAVVETFGPRGGLPR